MEPTNIVSFKYLRQRWIQETSERLARSDAFRRQLLQKGTPIFKKYNIQQVYLFGSVASGCCLKLSDIDLYVSALPNDLYWQFRHELEEAVQLPIDLYTDSDDSRFVQKVVERGEKIYGV
ncbi:MAG: nucleotidyltransferase domain-containing protein [Desulfosarcina sp.]|nr:nucleotidyltransferase domain-containing protein [Desulfobacterales bacterium]